MPSTTSKRKRARKSTSNPVEAETVQDPLTQISTAREKLGNQLRHGKRAENYDIHQNVLEIRAILSTNAEIFDRVVGSMKSSSSYNETTSTTFTRYGFQEVRTREVDEKTHFITNPELSESSFNTTHLTNLPKISNMSDILPIPYKTVGDLTLVDYELLLEKSYALHDDILEPFLAKLKDHLSSVQVCLGKVDSWLMEANEAINFLETTFKMKLKVPGEDEFVERECSCPIGIHIDSEICLRCKNSFGQHKQNGNNRCNSYGYGFFTCKKYITLKQYSTDGKHEATFDVTKGKEREKLKKFLDFVRS